MNNRVLAAVILAAFSLASTPVPRAGAQSARPPERLQYHWTAGQTLRYLIQRDPYFADPEGAVAAINPGREYQPPVVERLTEAVQAVGADGTATVALTLTAEPGLDDDAHPQATLKRTVTVTPSGRILAVSGGALGRSPAERDLLRGLPALPATADRAAASGQAAVWTHALAPAVTERRSPDHDGTLLRTTRAAQSDQIVFDRAAGSLVRLDSTLAISSRLVMTGRGRRGIADFGHVVPHVQLIQTLSVERQDDLLLK